MNRRKSTNFVDSIAREFEERDKLIALITPEGTRSYQPSLKSGYYHLAIEAGVPIVLAGPNYADKTFTLMAPREPLATFAEDEADLIEFCKTFTAYRPEQSFR